jgi:beta-xylosidase
MDGYHAFSSTDMINWTDHGEVLHTRDIPWAHGGWLFAPGAAHKNGKYYIYFPVKDKEKKWKVGVAVSDAPQGPFEVMDKPLEGFNHIDPMCFIDDDGEAYLYNNKNVVAKLKPNMIEVAEKPRKIVYAPEEIVKDTLRSCLEGSYMHKKDGIYYYSYTNWKNPEIQGYYAMGSNPYGPFEWKGALGPAPNDGAQDHHSIIEFKGQWYYFYHIGGKEFIPEGWNGYRRIACYDKLYYNEDGTIQMIKHTKGKSN